MSRSSNFKRKAKRKKASTVKSAAIASPKVPAVQKNLLASLVAELPKVKEDFRTKDPVFERWRQILPSEFLGNSAFYALRDEYVDAEGIGEALEAEVLAIGKNLIDPEILDSATSVLKRYKDGMLAAENEIKQLKSFGEAKDLVEAHLHSRSYALCELASEMASVISDIESVGAELRLVDYDDSLASFSFSPGEITVEPISSEVWIDESSILMPAGRYFVGDPLYTIGQDNITWQEWCKVAALTDRKVLSAANCNGFPVASIRAVYGDGKYFDQFDNEYKAYSKRIGVVPYKLIEKMGIVEEDLEGDAGNWFYFKNDFIMKRSEDGWIEIDNHIFIETDLEKGLIEMFGEADAN